MGCFPPQIYELTLWELAAAVEGHNKVHGGGDSDPPELSTQDYEAIMLRNADFISDTRH